MNAKTFADFEFAARAAGFEEVLERRWAPDTEIDVHTHNFDAEALVTQSPGSDLRNALIRIYLLLES